MSALLQEPIELLERIVDEVDLREDLLSFALTCTRLCGLIIPAHLRYRRVVISLFFRPFFDLVKDRPDLARRVRELTLVNTSQPNIVVPRIHAFRRDFPESRLLFASGYDDEFLYTNPFKMEADQPFDIRSTLDGVLYCFSRLRRLRFRGDTGRLPLERILTFHHDQLVGFSLDRKFVIDTIGDVPFPLLSSCVSRQSQYAFTPLRVSSVMGYVRITGIGAWCGHKLFVLEFVLWSIGSFSDAGSARDPPLVW